MKQCLRLVPLVFLIALFSKCLAAQEKIYSLTVKEADIENAIHTAISPFLRRSDYVLKVRLQGKKEVERIRKEGPHEIVSEPLDPLPGFEPEDDIPQPKITEIVGDRYWRIERQKIDLIIHKELTPSLYEYIEKTAKAISGFDAARGDILNLDPILPKTLPEDPLSQAKTEKDEKLETAEKFYGFTQREWIYLCIFLALVLLIGYLMWKGNRMKRNLSTLVETIEDEGMQEQTNAVEDSISALKKAQQERMRKQEEQLGAELLRDENDKIARDIISQLIGRQDFAGQIVEEYGKDKQGVEKIARLIAILGPNVSRKLFSEPMEKERYLKLENMAEELEIKPEEERELLREIQKALFAKQLLVPEEKSLDPFSFLYRLTPDQIAFLINPEPIKMKAIVLSRLNSVTASSIITRLPKEERRKVVLLLGKMKELPSEIADKVAFGLAAKAQYIPDGDAAKFDGINMLVDVIGESGAEVRSDIISSLRVSDRKLSSEVESRFFLFDSIPVVPEEILTAVVRRLPPEEVITAIGGASKQLQEKVILCFPQKIRRALVGALKAQKPDVETIKDKRRKFVLEMQKMGEEKRVDLRKVHAAWEKISSKRSSA